MLEIIFKVIHLIIAVVLHETAHGLAASKEGDPTPLRAGRISLNPLKHIDPFFTVLLPLLLILSGSPIVFGAAKPVPINPFYFKRGRLSFAIVSASGISINLLLAFIFSLLLFLFPHNTVLSTFFSVGVWLNIILAVFNAIPIPPLDGSRILYVFLNPSQRRTFDEIERYGYLILFIFLYFFGDIVFRIAMPIANIFFLIAKQMIKIGGI
ncbi:MAG: site-2 protease family protein [Actinobacteria bacterium]|nr:site-2 protease family protein [Actinomycetota bacterium]